MQRTKGGQHPAPQGLLEELLERRREGHHAGRGLEALADVLHQLVHRGAGVAGSLDVEATGLDAAALALVRGQDLHQLAGGVAAAAPAGALLGQLLGVRAPGHEPPLLLDPG